MDDFDAFVRSHGSELARLAFLLSGDRGHAEDLVQSTLLRAHKKWDRIASMDRPVAYVRTMLSREHISWRRHRYTTEVVTDANLDLSAGRSVADPAESIVLRDATWRRLATLSRRQRTVLVLKYYLDLSDDDIAETLHCSAATVRSHATRGLRSLRDTIDVRTEETLAHE